VSIGLLLTALGLGLRHGIDWDHIAAIADLSGTSKNRRQGFILSMAYAVGHGIVVFALGTLAIAFGLAIPDALDEWMGRVVGLTLIALGLWILIELVRKGRDFRLQSRWMLVLNGTFAGFRRVRNGLLGRQISVEHDHSHEHSHELENDAHDAAAAHDHSHAEANDELVIDLTDSALAEPAIAERALVEEALVQEPAAVTTSGSGEATAQTSWRERLGWNSHAGHSHSHSHTHRHDLALPDQADATYGRGTATGIGMLHGVGIESPTQIAIFVASTAAAGVGFGLMLLGTWVLGLIIANAFLALLAGAGLLNAERSFPVYATLAALVGVASLALGVLYIAGLDVLPALS